VLLSLLPPEAQLLFLSASDHARDPDILRLLQSDLDWVELSRLADIEKAVPVLWRRIESVAPSELPPDVEAHFRKLARVVSFRMGHLEQLVMDSSASLDRGGIEHALLKGAALACAAYGSFAERPMVDFDLLVRETDAKAAVDALLSAGWVDQPTHDQRGDFSNCHHLAPLVDPSRQVSAEVHVSLLPTGAPFRVTTEAVLSSTRSVPFRGSEVRVPDALYLLLHSCLHFAWNPMFRRGGWRTFRDVKKLISCYNIDWDRFVELARSHRAGTCCFWTLHLARELVGAPVPEEILNALRPKLPGIAVRVLERHLALILLPSITSCPSVTLRRMMWMAGILPRASGHGASRPWQSSILRPEDQSAFSGRWDVQRAAASRRSARIWAQYWTSVLLAGGPTPR
jgi:hypothetical protein